MARYECLRQGKRLKLSRIFIETTPVREGAGSEKKKNSERDAEKKKTNENNMNDR